MNVLSEIAVRSAAAAMAIHQNLKGRKGFDHLFDDIDRDTLIEMLAEHSEIIEKIFLKTDEMQTGKGS